MIDSMWAEFMIYEIEAPDYYLRTYPNGRTLFYEGDDPEGFALEMILQYDFDPRQHKGKCILANGTDGWGPEGIGYTLNTWDEEHGFAFHCPAEHLDVICRSDYPLGS